MSNQQIAVILKSFETPDEVRVLQKGKFELVHLGGITIGRATYEAGWKWSEHVGPSVGATRCNVEHVGLVLSRAATAPFDSAQGRLSIARAVRNRRTCSRIQIARVNCVWPLFALRNQARADWILTNVFKFSAKLSSCRSR